MKKEKVSVVMAVYNGEPFITATVASILAQTYADFESIIVDDGSTDHTWNILTDFAGRDNRIILHRNEPNQGVVRALNKGLDLATGKYIARQDADDISLPERLTRQVSFLETHPDHGCVGVAVQKIDPDGKPLGIGYNIKDNESIQQALLDDMCICGPTILVRRECLQKIGFYFSDGLNASEDYDLCLRLAEVTRLAVIDPPLYLYRQHPHSASKTQEQRQAYNKAIALERAIRRRYGTSASEDKFAFVGRDFLRAAIIAAVRKDLISAHHSLEQALRVYPPLLVSDQPLEGLIRAYTPMGPVDTALDYTHFIFEDLLPGTRRLRRLESRILSDLHMSEVFRNPGQLEGAKAHLFEGIRQNPTWLLNTGVDKILAKTLINRWLIKKRQ